jgi:hypothetical protein
MADRKTLPTELAGVTGAQKLFDWFGYWPSFHDAEVISLHLNRGAPSVLKVHVCSYEDDVDPEGYFVSQKHVIVKFLLHEVSELELEDFSCQNVLFGLELTKESEGYKFALDPTYGLGGTILAQKVELELTPGEPEGDEVAGPGMQRGGARILTAEEEAEGGPLKEESE